MLHIKHAITERFVLGVEFLQCVALLWASPTSFPEGFRYFMRYIAWVNIDVPRFFESLYDTDYTTTPPTWMGGSNAQGLYWLVSLCWVLALVAFACLAQFCRNVNHCWSYRQDTNIELDRTEGRDEALSVLVGRLLVLPASVAFFRTLRCVQVDGMPTPVVAVDKTMECYGGAHTVRMVVFTIVFVVLCLTYLLTVAERVDDAVVHSSQPRHEKYLRSLQIEYALGVTDMYETSGLSLCSQYRLRATKAIVVHAQTCKVLFAGSYILLERWPLERAPVAFGLYFLGVLWALYFHPYRSRATNVYMVTLHLAALCMLGVVWARVSSKNLSAITVDTSVFVLLYYLFFGGIFLAVLGMVATVELVQVYDAASDRKNVNFSRITKRSSFCRRLWSDGTDVDRRLHGTIDTIGVRWTATRKPWRGCGCCFHWFCYCWGGERRPVLNNETQQGWLYAMKQANGLLNISLDDSTPTELIPVHLLKKSAAVLRKCWRESMDHKYGDGHLLARALHSHLQQIVALQESKWNESYYPNADLSSSMPDMLQSLRHTAQKAALVSPRMRAVVRKLLAVRAWYTVGSGSKGAEKYPRRPFYWGEKTKEEEGLRREDLESKADSDGEVLVEEEKAMEPEDSAPNGKRKTE